MHPGEHRIVLRAEPVHEQDAGGHFLLVRGLGFGLPASRTRPIYAGSWMSSSSASVANGRRHDRDPVQAAEADGPGEFHRQLEPERRHRMTGSEVVAGQPVVPGHVQRAGNRYS